MLFDIITLFAKFQQSLTTDTRKGSSEAKKKPRLLSYCFRQPFKKDKAFRKQMLIRHPKIFIPRLAIAYFL